MEIRAYREGMKCLSYEAMYDCIMKMGLPNLEAPQELVQNLHAKEDSETVIARSSTVEHDNVEEKELIYSRKVMVLTWLQRVRLNNSTVVHQHLRGSRLCKNSGRLLQKG
jgi:hypothetical protein